MKLTEPSHGLGAAINSRGASRTQAVQGFRLESRVGGVAGETQRAERVALHIVEIQCLARVAPLFRPTRAGRDRGERFDLLEFARPSIAMDVKFFADLEQAHAGLLAPQILPAGLHETRPQRYAHVAQFG